VRLRWSEVTGWIGVMRGGEGIAVRWCCRGLDSARFESFPACASILRFRGIVFPFGEGAHNEYWGYVTSKEQKECPGCQQE